MALEIDTELKIKWNVQEYIECITSGKGGGKERKGRNNGLASQLIVVSGHNSRSLALGTNE